jgi:hypothetical protein
MLKKWTLSDLISFAGLCGSKPGRVRGWTVSASEWGDHRFFWSAGYEPRASGARLTSGDEKPAYDCGAGACRLRTGAFVGSARFFNGA